MKDQLSTLHKQSFDLALEMAKEAESAFQYEKGTVAPESEIIAYDYWDNRKYGLLAGEKLQLTLRQLERAYQEANTREFELTKHISLRLLHSDELIRLRATGQCDLTVDEEVFDMDYPGHYNRRIKSVSISIPCIAGPYTTIPCTLRLNTNNTRLRPEGSPYNDRDSNELFKKYQVPITAIATSSAQNDSGVYELNFRDERYLPFEGAGVISNWTIELFNSDEEGKSLRQFDFDTITDVIMHVRYTAEEDQGEFKKEAVENLKTYLQSGNANIIRMFNLRQDFSAAWHQWKNTNNETGAGKLTFGLNPNHFPYRHANKDLVVKEIILISKCSFGSDHQVRLTILDDTSIDFELIRTGGFGELFSASKDNMTFELNFSERTEMNLVLESEFKEEIEDIFIVMKYGYDPK